MAAALFPTKFGLLRASAGTNGLIGVEVLSSQGRHPPDDSPDHPFLKLFGAWLDIYASGAFDRLPALPVSPAGTTFETDVWRAVRDVPPGEVATYRDIAVLIGRPGAARAVGGAVGRCPLGLVIPCHRVIASGDLLGGYGSALSLKKRLLEHEGFRVAAVRPDARVTRKR